jgi:predicted ATPase
MLTRLKVSGFKNLLALDVSFGPFTCVAGGNGTGKSNLFDAIQFLGALADRSLAEAAQSVRAEGRRAGEIESLFARAGDDTVRDMSFEAEMIVTGQAVDDLGQAARASITFLRYRLELTQRTDAAFGHLGPLEIVREELGHVNLGDAHGHLPFPHRASTWRKSAVTGLRRAPFISTEREGALRVVKVHQDGGGGLGPRAIPAASLPRTVLSVANAAETPTALAARREMQSWRLLQLEPSHLREPDEFGAPASLAANGSHLPATLARLAGVDRRQEQEPTGPRPPAAEPAYRRLAARLAELAEDVRDVWVDADPKRELLTLMASDGEGTAHAARALSGGTLRFLALAVLEIDPQAGGLLCVEEPENGIHPARIPALVQMLRRIPTDVQQPLGPDNPLRQLIVNTHSPAVVSQVPDASLLVAELRPAQLHGRAARGAAFACLPGTWRARHQAGGSPLVSRDDLLSAFQVIAQPPPAEPPRPAAADRDDDEQLRLYP